MESENRGEGFFTRIPDASGTSDSDSLLILLWREYCSSSEDIRRSRNMRMEFKRVKE